MKTVYMYVLLAVAVFMVGCSDNQPSNKMVVDASHDLFEDTVEYFLFDAYNEEKPKVTNIYPVDKENGVYRALVEYPIVMTETVESVQKSMEAENVSGMQAVYAGMALMQLGMLYSDWEQGDMGWLPMEINFQEGSEHWVYSLVEE